MTRQQAHPTPRPAFPHISVCPPTPPETLMSRRRLHEAMSGARALALTGPAGAGKTCLVLDYLASRRRSAAWLRLAPAQGDPANFFLLLAEGARMAFPRKKTHFETLSPEYALGMNTFAQHFFERLVEHLGARGTLVLDDYHALGPASPVHDLIASAVEVFSHRPGLILIGRHALPAAYARPRAGGLLNELGWPRIGFSPQETVQFLAAFGLDVDGVGRELIDMCGGWPAGISLLARTTRPPRAPAGPPDSREILFDYLAEEIFSDSDEATRDFLCRLSVLPWFSPKTAVALTGNADAESIIRHLFRRNCFVERSGGDAYRFHALSRAFLTQRRLQRLSERDNTALLRCAAGLLQAQGDVEGAMQCWAEVGEWPAYTALLLGAAPDAMRAGRVASIRDWLAPLPEAVVTSTPWLRLWRGECSIFVAPLDAMADFRAALDEFRASGDHTGMALAIAGALGTAFWNFESLESADEWLQAYAAAPGEAWAALPAEVEARLLAGVLAAGTFRGQMQLDWEAIRERAWCLIGAALPPDAHIQLGSQLVLHLTSRGRSVDALSAAKRIATPASEDPTSPAGVFSDLSLAVANVVAGQTRAAIEAADSGLARAGRTGVHIVDGPLLGMKILAHVMANEPDAASEALDRLNTVSMSGRIIDQGHYRYVAGIVARARGDYPLATTHLQRALSLARQAGARWPEANSLLARASVAQIIGDHDTIRALIAEARQLALPYGFAECRCVADIMEALLFDAQGDGEACLALLRSALGMARSLAVGLPFWLARPVLSRLCALALRNAIEPDYVRRLITLHGLYPNDGDRDLACWPWALRVHVLDRFEVVRLGETLRFSGKLQKRPLQLLKAIVVFGGRGVPTSALADALWPNAEGDAAQNSLVTALHRLRRLIGVEHALHVEGGKLSLDPDLCWTDLAALDVRLDRLEAVIDPPDGTRCEPRPGPAEAMLADLPSGPFGLDDDDPAVLHAPLERMRARQIGVLLGLAAIYCKRQDWIDSETCYERVLALEPLSESAHRGLIELNAARGDLGAAAAAYRRCERSLISALGIGPSARTQHLYASLVKQ